MNENKKEQPEQVPTLEEILKKITPENAHEEVDWGPPRGEEIW